MSFECHVRCERSSGPLERGRSSGAAWVRTGTIRPARCGCFRRAGGSGAERSAPRRSRSRPSLLSRDRGGVLAESSVRGQHVALPAYSAVHLHDWSAPQVDPRPWQSGLIGSSGAARSGPRCRSRGRSIGAAAGRVAVAPFATRVRSRVCFQGAGGLTDRELISWPARRQCFQHAAQWILFVHPPFGSQQWCSGVYFSTSVGKPAR